MELGRFLVEVRRAKGLGLREAAKAIGCTHQRLQELERGISVRTGNPTRPSMELVGKIARAYGLPSERLLALAGYAIGDTAALSSEERELLTVFGALCVDHRSLALDLLRTMAMRQVVRDE